MTEIQASTSQVESHEMLQSLIKSLNLKNRVHGFSSLLKDALIVAIVLSVAYFGWKGYMHLLSVQQKVELLSQHWVEMNQQTVLLKTVNEKLQGVSVEKKVKVADTIYNLCQVKQIPLSLVCAIIEKESAWDPTVTSSDSGAVGLMQVMPLYARPYCREKGIEFSIENLKDPVNNVIIGIAMLSDNHAFWAERGLETEGDYRFSLHSYFWGRDNTSILVSKKDQRVNVPNFAYPQLVMNIQKSYRSLGLL
jgi:hypothetical protein